MIRTNKRPAFGHLLTLLTVKFAFATNDALDAFDINMPFDNQADYHTNVIKSEDQFDHTHQFINHQHITDQSAAKSSNEFILLERESLKTKRTTLSLSDEPDKFNNFSYNTTTYINDNRSTENLQENSTDVSDLSNRTELQINQTIDSVYVLVDDNNAFYGGDFRRFRAFFLPLHGYLSLFACLFGIIANILNIIVLTRKEMHNSTNFILTGLAISDCIVMSSYALYAYHNFFRSNISDEKRFSYAWAVFTLLHSYITVIFHTTSNWLTVILAIWRYIAVNCFGNSHRNWFNMRRAIYVIFFTYLTCIFFCIPAYFSFTIKPRATDHFCLNDSICFFSADFTNFKENSYDFSGLISSNIDHSDSLPKPNLQKQLNSQPKNELNNLAVEFSNSGKQETKTNFTDDHNELKAKKRRKKNRALRENNLESLRRISENAVMANGSESANEVINIINDDGFTSEYDEESKNDPRINQLDTIQNNRSQPGRSEKISNETNLNSSNSTVKLNYSDQPQKLPNGSEISFHNISNVQNSKYETWRVTFSDCALMNNGRLQKINFWVYSVLNKIIPCCALTYLSLALIRMLYQSNERRHRLRSYGQQQLYSQTANSSFYNATPTQNQLPVEFMNSTDAQKSDKNEQNHHKTKSLPNSPNSSNPNLLNPTLRTNYSRGKLSNNLIPTKMNESISTNLISNINLSALSPTRSKLKISSGKRKTAEKFEPASNQSLNQPMNLSSRNNSSASYIYPPSLMNTSSSFNRSCRLNSNTNCDRTTRMLLAILFLFLITEFPSGILSLLAGILGDVFLNNVYINLGEVMDLLALINNGVNFILYCTMSRQFRKTFQKTFCCNCICFFRPIVKQAADNSINAKTGNQLLGKHSSPNGKMNQSSQKISSNHIHVNKKVSSNEIDDDDQELVTMNETKQNSSTKEMEGDYRNREDYSLGLGEMRKSSLNKQNMVIRCKEICVDPGIKCVEHNQRNCMEAKFFSSKSLIENSCTKRTEDFNHAGRMASNGFIVTESLIKNVLETNAELGKESRVVKNEDSLKAGLKLQTMHRNLSIDASCNHDNRRCKLSHRYNDSRKRRRKTIANIETDCKKSSFSTCV